MDLPLLPEAVEAEIRRHAENEYPREACGLVVDIGIERVYLRCRNKAAQPEQQFVMHPEDYAEAEDAGSIVAVVHSHPDSMPYPSECDLVYCNRSARPWFIVGCQNGSADGVIYGFLPDGRQVPLIGRPFVHGVQDCYEFVRDAYRQELGVVLMQFHRDDGWWKNGDVSLYEDNFEKAGFFEVPLAEIKRGDMIVMQVRAPVPNHAAFYDGDGYIMHHMYGRLSSRELYGPLWQRLTRYIKRHRSQA